MPDSRIQVDSPRNTLKLFGDYCVKALNWFSYAYHGTLCTEAKLRYEWWKRLRQFRRQEQRLERWRQLQVNCEWIEYRLEKGLYLLLPTGEKLSELIYTEIFESDEQQFLRSYLQPGDIFVDVGANIGLFTLLAAKAVGNTGRVFAFEPAEATFQWLVRSVRHNNLHNVCCYDSALSDKPEKRVLTMSTDGFGAYNSLGMPTAGSKFIRKEIQCVTWDSFAEKHNLQGKVTLMKIDVEGWEYHVLNGGSRTLFREDAPDLLIEFTDENATAAGLSCKSVFEKLVTLGYQLYSVDMQRRNMSLESLRSSYPYVNLLATKSANHIVKRLGFSIDQ